MAISRELVAVFKNGGTTVSGWVQLPTPSDYVGTSSTLVSSARNAGGQVVCSVVRSDIAKVELSWNFLTTAQYATIAQLFEPKYNGAFILPVSFFDFVKNGFDGKINAIPNSTTNVCRLFYCGDRKVTVAKIVLNNDGTPKGYSGVRLSLVDTGRTTADN